LTANDKKNYIELDWLSWNRRWGSTASTSARSLQEPCPRAGQDRAKRQAQGRLVAQADELRDRAMSLKEKQEAAKKAAAAEGEEKPPQPNTQPPSSH
jgi:hypothetical protein